VSLFLDFIASQKERGVRLIGTNEREAEKRVPTISFVVEGLRSQAIVEEMDKHKIGIRFGGFYSNKLVFGALGLEKYGGVVRVSFVHYNTLEEVQKCIKALDAVITQLLAKK